MARTLVVCSDGTGNSLHRRASNVSALIGLLALDRERQIVIYDQGIGTGADPAGAVDRLQTAAARDALLVQGAAPGTGFRAGWDRLRGQATGHGLKENVGQLYLALAEQYAPGDRVFLFGFSRGAFTVRALAGLLHRCGLPRPGDDGGVRFEQAWTVFQQMRPVGEVAARIEALKGLNQDCPVHFLGVWDTVKSHGGLLPVRLPHLRHNPDVRHVRHALALDERRAWFTPTTWGGLDLDQEPARAMSRLDPAVRQRILDQDVLEVWFRGAHSDIGGGGEQHATTARIALRWMTSEAAAVDGGLALSPSGVALLEEADPPGPPVIHPSWTPAWRAVEQVPRLEIDNARLWPVRVPGWGSTGVRKPALSRREGVVHVHTTAADHHAIPGPVHLCETGVPHL
ncbi:DUF2235 domain-containing protein [Kineosporia sp. R_H_3]|uniref:phospholipase effector Tle1 domain-containing protein n=1 Tax=Kineosporia sp. R_H_3 TaxID=1961848 RepID=UPI000B4B3108|nr:DUF2235 domain-containing protein [Kineosporia sp. R_H_3]